MPALDQDDAEASDFVKLLYIGDSGTGKTGSLVSLVPDYDLRLLDLDSGRGVLKAFAKKLYPDRLGSIGFVSVRDQFKADKTYGATVKKATAFTEVAKYLTEWDDGTTPSEWGKDKILVIDTLTTLGNASLNWAQGMDPLAKDGRQWYNTGQTAIENIISMVTSDDFKTNVIVIAHINYTELKDGTTKGYPSALGSKLGPKIGKYFNNLVVAERSGTGLNVKRRIRLVPTELVDVKLEAPFAFPDMKDLPLETGMAELFAALKAN